MSEVSRIPIILLTGFLGAGKTTLLRRFLRDQSLEHTAFVVNEIGAVGLDQELLKQNSSSEPVLLSGGCICCAMRQDLGYTLRSLYLQREEGTVPRFERLVIETTGLANPGPIARSLLGDTWLMKRFDLSNTVAIVDAVNGLETLDTHPEAVEQVALADTLLISKLDIVPEGRATLLVDRLAALNPIVPAWFLDDTVGAEVLQHRRRELVFTALGVEAAPKHSYPEQTGGAAADTAVWDLNKPISWAVVAEAFDQVMAVHGAALLRVKGILDVEGVPGPVLVNAVQRSFHPPEAMDHWPGENRNGKVVFITRGIDADIVLEDFKSFCGAVCRQLS
ncbi:CobW family GTP-binding protein [Marinobacter sp. GN3S48]|uniref:CobW family GTP-binding protein n=1 Tax=Marinobacter sp. GN3S48 TaxID=3382302 RepID=UPI00387B52D5